MHFGKKGRSVPLCWNSQWCVCRALSWPDAHDSKLHISDYVAALSTYRGVVLDHSRVFSSDTSMRPALAAYTLGFRWKSPVGFLCLFGEPRLFLPGAMAGWICVVQPSDVPWQPWAVTSLVSGFATDPAFVVLDEMVRSAAGAERICPIVVHSLRRLQAIDLSHQ